MSRFDRVGCKPQRRRLWVPELGRHVTLKLTTGDLRTVDKIGLLEFAKKHGAKVA